MKTEILVSREDDESGIVGYMVKGTKLISYPMVATEGLLIAHDILEHVNGIDAIGSLDDELQALAGVWYCRGWSGELRRDSMGSAFSVEENIASDVINMAGIYNNGVNFRTPVPKTKECDLDDVFETIIDIAKGMVEIEIDESDRDEERLDAYFNACLHYMRQGYRKIKKRFPDKIKLNNLFWNIAQTCEPYVRHAEYEGEELILKYEYASGFVSCEEYFEFEEDY